MVGQEKIFAYAAKFNVGDVEICVAITTGGKIKIGSVSQLQMAHMLSFWLNPGETRWYTIRPHMSRDCLVHVKYQDGEIVCNCGPDLKENDTNYPYTLMTKLRYLSIQKRAVEIRASHKEFLRVQLLSKESEFQYEARKRAKQRLVNWRRAPITKVAKKIAQEAKASGHEHIWREVFKEVPVVLETISKESRKPDS